MMTKQQSDAKLQGVDKIMSKNLKNSPKTREKKKLRELFFTSETAWKPRPP